MTVLCFNFTELKALVIYITGSYVVRKKSIKVEFMESTDFGTVVARTCSNLIIFPQNIFKQEDPEAFAKFNLTMNGIIDLKGYLDFNTI